MKNFTLPSAVILTLLFSIVFTPLHAQTAVDCKNATTQTEINLCAGQQFITADKELNTVYKKALATLTTPQQALLVNSQQQWIKYRDGYAKVYSAIFAGGSMMPGVVSDTKTQATRARITELQKMISR